MPKTLKRILKQDWERFVVPKKVQDIIPVRTVYPDGIFLVGKNKYSKMFRFEDINYAVASIEDKKSMLMEYSDFLNSLDSAATTKITVNNRRLNRIDFERNVLIPQAGDSLDPYREDQNRILLDAATGSSAIVQEKYVTISVVRNSVEDARTYFARAGAGLMTHFGRLGSRFTELGARERLQIIFGFFRMGEEAYFDFDMRDCVRKGFDFRDLISPDSYEHERDYFRIGERFGRVLFLKDFASYISDEMVKNITENDRDLMFSIDIIPMPIDEAVKFMEQRILGVETNIANWQRKQNMNNNFSAVVPYDMELMRQESKEVMSDLTTNDQKIFHTLMTIVITAETLKKLNYETEALKTIAREKACELSCLHFQQWEGLMTVLPYGVRKIDVFRTLTTQSLAAFVPFTAQEIFEKHGIYYGKNKISGNMIIVDRRNLLNGNSFILGVSGSGKSMTAKQEIIALMLSTDADIIIIDPEMEYQNLVKELGGEVIKISATSPNHINAMDMSRDYGESNPVIEKSQFLQSLCEQIIAGHQFSKGQQSIIDRCTENVYRYYQQGGYMGTPPTLQDFRNELLKQPEPEAQSLALELELFTRGSLNTFAQQTNVDTDNRLICYDILELGEQLKAIGMLVILDSILNRITSNRKKGKETFIFIDELYLLFMHEYSAQFLFKLWKRVRKYGAYCTGITQNVEDLLQSHTARAMLSNSEFIVMLNQAATDRQELARLLNIADTQIGYITNVDVGEGLLKIGSSLVPFVNRYPKDTKLYRLMTTKLSEQSRLSSDPVDMDQRELNILAKIREVARTQEEFRQLVERFLPGRKIVM